MPRVLITSAIVSITWITLGYGYSYGILRLPGSPNYSLALLFTISCINGTILLIGWMCLDFFYHLFDSFNRLQIQQLSLATHAKEAELRALKSQVNPHFIFNSLNSLRALIEEDRFIMRLCGCGALAGGEDVQARGRDLSRVNRGRQWPANDANQREF